MAKIDSAPVPIEEAVGRPGASVADDLHDFIKRTETLLQAHPAMSAVWPMFGVFRDHVMLRALQTSATNKIAALEATLAKLRIDAEGYRLKLELTVIQRDQLDDFTKIQEATLDAQSVLLRDAVERAANFLAFIQGEYGVRLSAEDRDDHNVAKFLELADARIDALHPKKETAL